MAVFKPKRIEEPGEGGAVPPRPSSKELAAALGPIAATLISTSPPPPVAADPPAAVPPPVAVVAPATPPEPAPPAPVAAQPAPMPAPSPAPLAKPAAEPVLMMSFKASRPFAKLLAEAAEGEGGLRRLVARVFHEAGYAVPPSELQPQRRRRTYD